MCRCVHVLVEAREQLLLFTNTTLSSPFPSSSSFETVSLSGLELTKPTDLTDSTSPRLGL